MDTACSPSPGTAQKFRTSSQPLRTALQRLPCSPQQRQRGRDPTAEGESEGLGDSLETKLAVMPT
jgi:hypothetical protein